MSARFLDANPSIKIHSAYDVATRGIEAVAGDVVAQMAGCGSTLLHV